MRRRHVFLHFLSLLAVISVIAVIGRHLTSEPALAEGPELVTVYSDAIARDDLVRIRHALRDKRVSVHFDVDRGKVLTDHDHLQRVTTLLAEERLPRGATAGTHPFRLPPTSARSGSFLDMTPYERGEAFIIRYRPSRGSYPTIAERLSHLESYTRAQGMSPPEIEVLGLPERARPMEKEWEIARDILETERRAIDSITAALPHGVEDKTVIQVKYGFVARKIPGEDTMGAAPSGELVAPLRVRSIRVTLLTNGLQPAVLDRCLRRVTTAAGLDKSRGDFLEVDNTPWSF
jgi:hypothetical protein